jgi:hypothetical protein
MVRLVKYYNVKSSCATFHDEGIFVGSLELFSERIPLVYLLNNKTIDFIWIIFASIEENIVQMRFLIGHRINL